MKKGNIIMFAAGALAGLALCGPVQAATAALTATPSRQTFYLNGQKIDLTAYAINGNNYVKLRDVGRAVDFGVTYDGKTNSVYIDPDAHYQEEVTPPAQTTTSPSIGITEESVQATLWGLMEKYPNGTPYGAPYRSTSNGPYSGGMNCAGWATLCSDAAFGDLPWRRVKDPGWDEIRVGDLIRYDNSAGGHVVVVLEKADDYILTTESGTNNKARWGGQYLREWLETQPGYENTKSSIRSWLLSLYIRSAPLSASFFAVSPISLAPILPYFTSNCLYFRWLEVAECSLLNNTRVNNQL